jgi:hypothetical protein
MLSFDYERWNHLTGGYKMPFDPRPSLRKPESPRIPPAWQDLWEELHHQGDLGDASYAERFCVLKHQFANGPETDHKRHLANYSVLVGKPLPIA